MRQDYVEWIFRGLMFAESDAQPVNNTLPIPPVDWPDNAVGYRFFHRFETRDRTEGGETIIMKSEPRGYTPWTYRGKTLTLADVAKIHGSKSILHSNMEINGWSRVIDVGGNVWPLNEGDSVIEHDYAA